MNTNLARVLVSRGIIRQGTVIEAYQNVRSLSCQCDSRVIGSFIINRARLLGGTRVVFDTVSSEQVPYVVRSEEITMVDGMMINRIALTQNLSLDGIAITGRVRRGRRKKISLAAPSPCAELHKCASSATVQGEATDLVGSNLTGTVWDIQMP